MPTWTFGIGRRSSHSTKDILSDNVCQKDKRNTAIRVHVIGTSAGMLCLIWDKCPYDDDDKS